METKRLHTIIYGVAFCCVVLISYIPPAAASDANVETPGDCRMQGVWYFNKEKTLADMSAKGVEDKELMEALANPVASEFITEFTCDKVRMYFPKRGPAKWMSYKILDRGDNYVVFKLDIDQTGKRIEFEGDCYKESAKKQYYVYNCKTKP